MPIVATGLVFASVAVMLIVEGVDRRPTRYDVFVEDLGDCWRWLVVDLAARRRLREGVTWTRRGAHRRAARVARRLVRRPR